MGIRDKHDNQNKKPSLHTDWSHTKLYDDFSSTKDFFNKQKKNSSTVDQSGIDPSTYIKDAKHPFSGYVHIGDYSYDQGTKITTTKTKDSEYMRFDSQANSKRNSLISELRSEVDYLLSRLIEDAVGPTEVRRCLEKVRKIDGVIGKIEDELKESRDNE